jgi:uncharacterized protein YcbK (DUF882 family)
MRYDTDKNAFVFDKGEDEQLSPHFRTKEFTCQCKFDSCRTQWVNKLLLEKLEAVRNEYGAPISVTSGFRCHEHQLELAAQGKETATTISQHELGKAADIKGGDMQKLQDACDKNFQAMGVARSFIHVDTRSDKLRRWGYTKE